MSPWITVIGIGADGLSGLSEAARLAIGQAELLVGGERHQAMVAEGALAPGAERLTWACGMGATAEAMRGWRGRRVVVLASGDPMHFGAGSTLARHFDAAEMEIVPHPGAFSLACARMVWSVPDVTTLTVHGRALDAVNLHLAPDARLVALSWNGETPARLAALLTDKGFGGSRITALCDMESPNETRVEGTAADWRHPRVSDLNTVCVECVAGPDAVWWPRTPGLPEAAYVHDSQITKREVRAATLAALGPLPGETLWDVGAGAGTVAIEWMRACDGAHAVAVERDAARAGFVRTNAASLGVPRLDVIDGEAPAALDGIDGTPDAVFVGGGVSAPGVLEAAFERLRPGGRLVANAVTTGAQQRLLAFAAETGGSLTRLSVARSGAVGGRTALRPMMDVLQLRVEKPR